MPVILGFIATRVGKYVAMALLGVGTFGGWLLLHDHKVRVAEHRATVFKIDEGAKRQDERARKAAQNVDGLGDDAVARSLRQWCGDCN